MKALLAVAALALAAAVPATAGQQKTEDLEGKVGPGFTITLKRQGKTVKTLRAGRYVFKIEDEATFHDFHLKGPGVNRKTSVSGTGRQSWTLTLRKGTYTYVCDPHSSQMRGSFRVL